MMAQYQLQGQGKKYNEYTDSYEMKGDWSTEYIGDSEENSICDTREEAEQLMAHCMESFPESTPKEFRIIEL